MKQPTTLSRSEARQAAIAAQGLSSTSQSGGLQSLLEQIMCIQIDAITAIRRAHDMAQIARSVDPRPSTLEQPTSFETWGHAHSMISLDLWPLLGWRRRYLRNGGLRGPDVEPDAVKHVLATLSDGRPRTLSDFGPARGEGWNRTSAYRWACDWLLSVGDIVCVSRDTKWRREYVLPDVGLPPELLQNHPSDEEAIEAIISRSVSALGIATVHDVADYLRISPKLAEKRLASEAYTPIRVEGSTETWFAAANLEIELGTAELAILSPLDPLIWTRPRQNRLFEKDYIMESYKTPASRQFGYYGMPVLEGDRIIGRIAAKRAGTKIEVEATEWDSDVPPETQDKVEEILEEMIHVEPKNRDK